MKASREAVDLIKQFESFRATPYLCPAGKLTIGFGTTRCVRPDMRVTEVEAEQMLCADLAVVESCLANEVSVPLSQHQTDALCSFVYNVGPGAFCTSTLLKRLNAGDYRDAADEFLRWDRSGGKILPGLTRRRRAERSLFLTPDSERAA